MSFLSPAKMAVILLVYLLGLLYSALSSDEFFADQKPRAMEKKSVVCDAVACQEQAQLIMSSIDNSMDPCDDFYSYVCKKRTTEVKGDDQMFPVRPKLVEDYWMKVKDILDSLPQVYIGETAMEKLSAAYQSCNQNSISDKKETREVRKVISKHGFPHWPIIPSAESKGKHFKSFQEFVLATSLDELLQVSLTRRPGMETSFIIQLKPKDIFIPGLTKTAEVPPTEDTTVTTMHPEEIEELFGKHPETVIPPEGKNMTVVPAKDKNMTENVTTKHEDPLDDYDWGPPPADTNMTVELPEPKRMTVALLEDKHMFVVPLEDAYIKGLPETRLLTSAARILKQYDSHKITGYLKRNTVQPATRELRLRSSTSSNAEGTGEVVERLMMSILTMFSTNATENVLKGVYLQTVGLMEDLDKLPHGDGTVMVKTIKEVESLIPGFPLLQSLNKYVGPVGVTLQQHDTIMLINAEEIVAYIKYLMKINPDDVFNSFGLTKAFHLLTLTSRKWRETADMQKYLSAIGETNDREEQCIDLMHNLFPDIITMLNVKKHYDESTRPMARHLLNVIGKTYYDRLAHTPWMDHDTWMKASSMLWNMKPYVAHSDPELDPEVINMRYKNVTFKADNAFITVLDRLHTSWFIKEYSLLHQDFKASGFDYPNYPVYSAYFSGEKHIDIGAGMLHGPFFHKDLPMAANLGGLGVYMANEIARELNYNGIKMDESRDKMMTWWSDYTMDAYQERATCFVKQYDRICEPLTKMKLNGTKTVANNLVDHVSVKIPFEALRATLKESNDMALPGLEDLSPEKLFFISYALPMCMNVTDEYLKRTIKMAPVAPNRYRVNVPLLNMMEFSAAFHCKRGSAMRPPDKERCTLW